MTLSVSVELVTSPWQSFSSLQTSQSFKSIPTMWVCMQNFLLSVQQHAVSGVQGNTVAACSASLVDVMQPMLLKGAASATEAYSNTSHRHVNCSP